MKPYNALQVAGRDIYIREGCYNCHSQMIRPFRAETERYGHYSVAGESVYDHHSNSLRLIGLRSLKRTGWHLLKPIDLSLLRLTHSNLLRLIDLHLLKQIHWS